MKKVSKAMYGKSMMKTGGTKKYQRGGDKMNTNTTAGEMPNYPPMKKGGAKPKTMMKTGGMVNANVKVSADKIQSRAEKIQELESKDEITK